MHRCKPQYCFSERRGIGVWASQKKDLSQCCMIVLTVHRILYVKLVYEKGCEHIVQRHGESSCYLCVDTPSRNAMIKGRAPFMQANLKASCGTIEVYKQSQLRGAPHTQSNLNLQQYTTSEIQELTCPQNDPATSLPGVLMLWATSGAKVVSWRVAPSLAASSHILG